jgi:uncharacterized protein (DUF885 family)
MLWGKHFALPAAGLLLVAPLIGPLPSGAQEVESAALRQLLDDAWQFDLKEEPLFATRVGDARYNDRLADVSRANQLRRLEFKQQLLQRAAAMSRDELSASDGLHYDIFLRMLNDELTEYEFESYLIPITNRSGFHIEFPELPKLVPLDSVKDYENYVARLSAFEQYTDEHLELMRAGLAQGMVLPAVVLQGYEQTLAPHIVDEPTRSLLYAPFTAFPERIAQADRERLTLAGAAAIRDSVVPGYQRFLEFMRSEYVPAARGSIAASALPRGREYYRHRVRYFTTLDLTPEQVHEVGLAEVRRIGEQMRAVPQRIGFEGDYKAFVEHLRSSPKYYAQTPEQLLKEVSLVLKRMDGELPALFKTLPRTPYGIREVPAYVAPRTTTAYYMQPSGDGSRAGFYYVNTFDLKSRPLYEIEALSLHEAVPGHHLQIALAQELAGQPPFRRFAEITAFVEGWALYSERLGLEVGFYRDPVSDFGRLSYEMWRACRLVVDTGMHYFGWTREQAIDFMLEHTALSRRNIEAEVDRYIAWPGQALAYKIGELKIRELRQQAEQQLGPAFNIREFHDIVLGSGAVPLTVLEQNVQRYIAERKR